MRTKLVTRALIESRQAIDLSQALSFQTGVRVENNCNNCNFSQVRLLGMDGGYSQILIDGDPVVSSLAGVYGLEHFPESMIDRIEIVKGGGSALYGGGAIAGTINLLTRRPLMNQTSINYKSISHNGEFAQNLSAVSQQVSDNGKTGAYIFGSVRRRNPYDHNDDGYSELGELNNESLGFNLYHKPISNGELMLHVHRIHEERRGGNDFQLPQHEADIAEWVEHWRWGGTLRWEHRLSTKADYRLFYSFAQTKRDSYYGGLGGNTLADTLEALTFYGKSKNPVQVMGGQFNYMAGIHHLTFGTNFSHDHLTDKASANPTYNLDETYTNTGVFLQDDLHLLDQLEIVAGVRMDKHSEIESAIISPRFNLKYAFKNGLNFRGSYSTGFKAPQTFDEDLHLGGVGGDQKIIRNSDDLKEERSHSYTTGLDYQGFVFDCGMMFGVTAFYTKLDDVFSLDYKTTVENQEIWERFNAAGATVQGIELNYGIQPTKKSEIRLGATFQNSEHEEINPDFNTKNFFRAPDVYGYGQISLDIFKNISLFTSLNYTDEMDVPHAVFNPNSEEPDLELSKSDPFVTVDIGATYQINSANKLVPRLALGVKNISNAYQNDLDIGANRDAASIDWNANLEFSESKPSSQKPVLIYLHADWCKWCKKLEKESFQYAGLIQRINKDFHPVKLDVDDQRDRISLNGRIYNGKELMEELEIKSLPVLIRYNPEKNQATILPGYFPADTIQSKLLFNQ